MAIDDGSLRSESQATRAMERAMIQQYKSILIGLSPQENSEQLIPAARFGIDLAKKMEACLTIHAFAPHLAWVPYSPWTDLPAQLAVEFERKSKKMANDAVASAKKAAMEAGVDCVTDMPDLSFQDLTRHFNQQSRVHDVIVLDSGGDALSNIRHLFSEALFNSGRPVIVIPPNGPSTPPQKIIIAWDGSARAARATSDAIPLLLTSQTVWIDVVTGEKDLPSIALGTDLGMYLERHGIKSAPTRLSSIAGNVPETLRRHALDVSADMIVMGAFVHSQAWQAILGGVTSSLLKDSPVPLLLAH